MSAGTGVTHSEMNPSKTTPVHFLQIWIMPDKRGYAPSYDQKAFPDRVGKLRVVASPDGRDGSIAIHQDVVLAVAVLTDGQEVTHALAKDRYAWIQIARGSVSVDGQTLTQGDGAAVRGEGTLTLRAAGDAEVLVFDLA